MQAKIDQKRIELSLEQGKACDTARVREVLEKALQKKGLSDIEMAVLAGISDPELLAELFQAAARVKQEIYGRRLVIFAPLYISNLCRNDCAYCAFRVRNTELKRRALSMDEIAEETRQLIRQGHKRLLLVAGESYPKEGFRYVIDAINTVYKVREGKGEIRRVNVNIAPLSTEEFRELGQAGIGTYQIFQETYHRPTYARVHTRGPKSDYDYRLAAMDRAMEAGIDDVGVGVLFGLFDWRWEMLALKQHAEHLEQRFGCGPHTISVPRLEPASGSDLAGHPPMPVSDVDFRKLIAILRLAVPYTGIIMSTRETASIRRESFALGVSQISAGSRTNPGGYEENDGDAGCQFSLGDHRSLEEVVADLVQLKYIPSFCTGCYRLGRTGADFMDLAKPGEIRAHCDPNAVSTFVEYLEDYAGAALQASGHALIPELLSEMEPGPRQTSLDLMQRVVAGSRDVFC